MRDLVMSRFCFLVGWFALSDYHRELSDWDSVRALALRVLPLECALCGECDLPFEVDHIVPLHLGGSNTVDNLQVLCCECHRVKSAGESSRFMKSFYARRFRPPGDHPGVA